MNQPPYPPQEPPQYEVSYPQAPPPQQSHPQQAYPQPGGYGPAQPRKSPLPLIIAAGLVVALAIGITLFLVLRDPGKDVAGGGGGGSDSKPSPEEVTKTFFVAVDEMDEPVLKKTSRGDVAGDIDEVMAGTAQTAGLKFGAGKSGGVETKKIDGKVTIAIVIWNLSYAPASAGGGLAVGLLDEGDGYRVCAIEDRKKDDAKTKLVGFEKQWESACGYSK